VLTIGQVLLEQSQYHQRTTQLPTITTQGSLGTFSAVAQSLLPPKLTFLKWQSVLQQVHRQQQRQQNYPAQNPQKTVNRATRPARIYTAKLNSGTTKNFHFSNGGGHQPEQLLPQDRVHNGSPAMVPAGLRGQFGLKSANRSYLMQLSAKKLN